VDFKAIYPRVPPGIFAGFPGVAHFLSFEEICQYPRVPQGEVANPWGTLGYYFPGVDPRTGSFSGFCLSLGYRIPGGLFTPGSFYPVVFANGLVLKNLAKWRDFHYSQIFSQTVKFRGFYIYSRLLICMSVIKHTV
jgi:hypothetical protein